MYRYVGTAGGGGHLLRDAGEIAAELTALRAELADVLARRREIERRQAAFEAALRGDDPAGLATLEEITDELSEVRDEMMALSEACEVLRDELCETLYLAHGTRVS